MPSAESIARAWGLRRSGREYTGACPCCGYKTGFSVTERDGSLLLCCAAGGCKQAALWATLCKDGLAPDQPQRESKPQRRKAKGDIAPIGARFGAKVLGDERGVALCRRAQPIAGTSAETYLRLSRSYTEAIPPSLGFAMCKHPTDGRYHPTMIASVVVEGDMSRVIAAHRTFLRSDGSGKTDLDPNKMSLGPCKGGAVPLAPPGRLLAVTEGIETGLSYMQVTGVPTWAALSTGGLRNLVLPLNVEQVIIAADPDIPGIRAAHAAARRWLAEGRQVQIARPPVGCDFNDLLRAS